MKNIAIKLQYDGTGYHGWQIQKNDVTVGETVKKAMEQTLGEEISLVGCGRTDAGVHAEVYLANFKTESKIPIERLPLAVNSRLPMDIAVMDAFEVEEDFNAILSCREKEYTYKILNSKIREPFLHKRVCFYPSPLNLELLERAGKSFVGTHDFAAVRSLGTNTKTTVRTVFYCDTELINGIINIKICADGFLYNMARAIVGTMVYAAHGKISPEDIPDLLKKGDRRLTGPTMPAHGLYMTRISYPNFEIK
ncbi:tRNA pseudouridine(38-40) synthase TruA [Clostridiaceae bacterium OttesenSCG-928-D20]|nr:tRNA pseudouridine(38-40) synthase TruA [Clostridiaceae bacterium OttesenSCG-928-D20]